ncbi:Angiopoietin-related protein 7 [Stylophora pistillata]|uniref:Angiopoietin-related protein 7 n=1 Tax=Stylophora pistillata TaxID=50429 RepID=A0A2B4STW6_STYPI|nr:Angiopoietin-related protein 7 [Stylophora pistillata]
MTEGTNVRSISHVTSKRKEVDHIPWITKENSPVLYQLLNGERSPTAIIIFLQPFVNKIANNTSKNTMRGIRQGIGFATVCLAFSVTFQVVPSMRAAPIDCKMNHTVYLGETTMEGNRDETSLRCIAKNCAELYKSGQRISNVYKIDPDGSGAFDVYCDQTTAGGGWAVFQKRFNGSVDFNRTWNDYKHGFGNFTGEFWLGLDKIYRLTRNETKNMLRVDLGMATGKTVHAEYSWFGIGNETATYRLYIGNVTSK